MYLVGILRQDGVINGSFAEKSERIVSEDRTFSYILHDGEQHIHISQNDVRAIQLAKAALYAGIRLLMERLGIESVDRIRLAGAFGNHIEPKFAMILGLIPDCNLKQVSSAGNVLAYHATNQTTISTYGCGFQLPVVLSGRCQ